LRLPSFVLVWSLLCSSCCSFATQGVLLRGRCSVSHCINDSWSRICNGKWHRRTCCSYCAWLYVSCSNGIRYLPYLTFLQTGMAGALWFGYAVLSSRFLSEPPNGSVLSVHRFSTRFSHANLLISQPVQIVAAFIKH